MNAGVLWETYYAPGRLEEALRLLHDIVERGERARLIAGGTDLLIELRRGVRQVSALVDVTRIADLDRVWLDERDWIHVGPAVTHNQAAVSPLLVERGYPLVQACRQVGTPALRNRGTIAGNLVTASPANDTITALRALDAHLTVRSTRTARSLRLADFYRGVRKTVLAPDEMVVDISFPALRSDQRGAFVKLGLRRTHAIALVNVAVVLNMDSDRAVSDPVGGGEICEARIALGSVAPTIIRASEAERALVGKTLDKESIADAADLAAGAAAPIDDLRGGADYRRQMVRVLVRRALTALRDDRTHAELSGDSPMLWGTSDGRYAALEQDTLVHRDGGPEEVVCTVNGTRVAVHGAGGKTLLQMLRDDLGFTGTKEGCGEGECGACTVWMDGIAVLACLVPAPRAHGTQIVTVEGLSQGDTLHPVQQAFIDEGAVQCGYCTPGFVMAGANLLLETPHPTREQIVAGLSGNLCRCTGYYKIVRALERAAERQ
jgi:carbon-monoxide dehydrogenase medium subunit